MIVSSKSFENNGTIPLKHTGFGEDISPELTIADAPGNTVSFAVVLDDLDVPFQKSFTHWIIWNIPKIDVIPEGLPYGAVLREPFPACQGEAWGKYRYRGPKQPVFIRKEHRYVFTVYALDCRLDISEKSRKMNLLDAMHGHILAEAKIIGKYKRG
ncbi:MAG: YbhB/YbcL family Raf kinase inhibitor-like protein [Lachnospiraceae bacterium]|nr:YbhB/YbcL family Raf kinase inhibitor-like protein [Lachnospiraceae bacterium]